MSLCALIVDDSEMWRLLFQREFRRVADSVWLAGNLAAAMRIVHDTPELHVVTLDLAMPGCTPGEVRASIAQIRERHPRCAVVIVTGDITDESRADSLAAEADAHIVKSAMTGNAEFFTSILLALYTRARGDAELTAMIDDLTSRLAPGAAREAAHEANARYIDAHPETAA